MLPSISNAVRSPSHTRSSVMYPLKDCNGTLPLLDPYAAVSGYGALKSRFGQDPPSCSWPKMR
eukprot:3590946-Rhodomonas_salina.2